MNLDKVNETPTYGEGAVAIFPRGAINHPSLLVSAYVLFDSVTVLRPIDIESECVHRGFNWHYRLRPNHEADNFWLAALPLVEAGVLKAFQSKLNLSRISELHHQPGDTPFAQDQFDGYRDGTGETRYFAVGFTEYFQYVGANGLPLIISGSELHDVPPRDRSYPLPERSKLSGNAIRILNSCLPEIATKGYPADRLALAINDIREKLQHERPPYASVIGRLSASITEPLDAEEYVATIDKISSDSVEIWEAYISKLTELASIFSLPVRFVPLFNSLVTLDQIACGKHLSGVRGEALAAGQQKQMMAFIWWVDRVVNFWR